MERKIAIRGSTCFEIFSDSFEKRHAPFHVQPLWLRGCFSRSLSVFVIDYFFYLPRFGGFLFPKVDELFRANEPVFECVFVLSLETRLLLSLSNSKKVCVH